MQSQIRNYKRLKWATVPGDNTTLSILKILLLLVLGPVSAFAATPDAIDDEFSTASGTTVNGILSGNDLNLDGPGDVYSKASDPVNGSAVVNGDGSFTYTPNIGFAGLDQFSYSITDGAGGSDTAIVNVDVASSSNFLTTAAPVLITAEDTAVPLGITVSPDLFNGGALLDVISTDTGYRSASAGATPVVSSIPAGTSSIVITGFSTLSSNTSLGDDINDDYQLLNARIDLKSGTSSGRVAFLYHGKLTSLDQYNWENVPLGQAVLSDPTKVVGHHTGASNPLFKLIGNNLQIIESHSLETAYHIEFMTSDGDSTNFIGAGNAVQTAGQDSSMITLPSQLEPTTGKHGFVILNSISAAAGSNFAVEHKGFNRLFIDLDTGTISGSIAAQQGETENNTVTYSFSNYPLIDQRIGGTPVSALSSSATVIGDVTAKSSVKDDPTIYINADGNLIVQRAGTFSNTFTTMYTAEFYERTGFSSIASFVSVGSDDALFDSSPADDVDANGKRVNELLYDVPASARVGIFLISWNTIGGNGTNENIGMGFAIVDLDAGISSGSITFIRTTTPDLVSWDAVPFGQSFFGATAGGNPLFQSNKTAGSFTDPFAQTAALALTDNPDGTRTLAFTATSTGGAQNFRDYQGNAQVTWLGNEPFAINGLQASDGLSGGSPTDSGDWEIDFADISGLTYTPAPHETGQVSINFSLSSTGEAESILINVHPVADAPSLSAVNIQGYPDLPFSVLANISDSADLDGSESQISQLELSGVPATVTLSASTGAVTNNGSGNWTVSSDALATLTAIGSRTPSTEITVTAVNVDQDDIDGDTVIEDGDNGAGVDELDELTLQTTFELLINDLPTVSSLLVNNGTPVISGTANLLNGETLTVLVNNITYTSDDNFLVDNGNGTWTLSIPTDNALTENTYEVVAQLSHTSGNSGADLSTDELIVDLTPPPAPGVTSQTTTDNTPLISGTTTVGSGMTLKVEVNSVIYTVGDGHLIDNDDGTWDLTIPTTLIDATYQVIATLTDTAGNIATDPGVDELTVDTTAPPTPGVTSLTTNDTTPTISGTAILIAGDVLTVLVNEITYTSSGDSLIVNDNGTWNLNIPTDKALSETSYDVTAVVTDLASNTATDSSSQELLIDLTAPVAPTVTTLTTNTGTPTITGTAIVNNDEVLTVEINDVVYMAGAGDLVDHGDGTWTLTIPPSKTLTEDTFDVITTVTDAAGNFTRDSTVSELDIDLTVPVTPTVTFLLTTDATPSITGTASLNAGEALSVKVNDQLYNVAAGNLINNGNGTWELLIPAPNSLDDGSYDVVARVTDLAGNSTIDASTADLVVDSTPPPAPGVTSQTTMDSTPLISGTTTVGSGLTLNVEVNNVIYSVGDGHLIDNDDGTWDLTIPTALIDATYQVIATLTDAAGNTTIDPGTDELVVDTTAPPTPGVTSLTTNDTTPTISGTATLIPGDTLTVSVNTKTYTANDGNLIDNGDGTWDLTIPTINLLPEAGYDVTATVTDAALNTSADPSSGELLVDTTAPAAPAVTAQTINTTTPMISGTATVNSGETLTVEVNNILYTAGDGNLVDNGDGTWNLLIPADNALPETTLDVLVSVSDAAGNTTTDATSGELLIDLTPPAIPTVTFLLTNNNEPTVAGNVASTLDDILTVTLNNVLYTDGDGHLTDNRDGTWALIIPTDDALPETTFDVIATLTDTAGNVTPDSSNPDLIIDLTPPPAPGVTSQTTMDSTPLISGTTTVGSGLTLNVEVNNVIYSVGDGHLIDNGDGTWDLTIPTALIDATYQVIATLTDAAGNVATDPGTDDLVVDTTAPTTPGVTSLTTNDTTPLISGTAASVAGDTLTVSVNTVTYTAGDGNLTDNGDGTWDLTIPNANLLPEAGYDVTATVTDAALNTSTDPSSSELLVDTTAPTVPTVISQSINTTTPMISGTVTVNTGETLTVEVNNILYTANDGSLTDNGDGTWDLLIPADNALPETTFDVIVTVTDAAGNFNADSSVDELIIDLTPPAIPTVTFLLTNNNKPTVAGNVASTLDDTLTVTLNNVLYTDGDGHLTDNRDGTWALIIPTDDALPENTFDVIATLTDTAGNVTPDSSNPDLIIDLTPPPAPGVTSQTTMDSTPLISGTTTVGSGLTLSVEVNNVIYSVSDGHLIDNGDGTWDLTIPTALIDATYQVIATLTDAAGNVATDPGTDELVIDTNAPPTPGVTSLTTNDTTPTISGTATLIPGDSLTVSVNTKTYTAGDGHLIDNGDGTWDLTIPTINLLPEAGYDVTATVTDAALNTSTDPSSGELLVDTTAPAAPAVTAQTINTTTPMISGTATVNTGETLTVEVNNILYTTGDGNLVDNGDGTWNLLIPADNALPETTLDVLVSVSDAAGNTTSDATSGELLIDLTPPATPTVTFLLTNNNEPTVAGNVASTPDDTLTVTLNNVLYTDGDGHLTDNRDGTWALIIPTDDALPETTFDVIATLTDTAGNVTPDSSNPDLIIDLTPPPAPGVTSQTTMDSTPLISGTTTVGSGLTLNVEVNNVIYSVGDGHLIDNGDGTWDLTIPTALIDATYQVIATLTDAAGNVATDPGTNELVIDTNAPPTPGVTSLTTNDTTPTISGTATLIPGDSLTVSVNTKTYTANDGNLVDNGDGTWDLTIPTINLLPEAGYDVTATVTDAALNTSTDPSSGELFVDTTAPAAPAVTAQTINTTTPMISGTATVNTGETLTVEVNNILYTANDGSLTDNGDGTWDLLIPADNALPETTFDVIVTVTDAAGNFNADSSVDELIIDITNPAAVIVTIDEDGNNDGLLSIAESNGLVDVSITLALDAAIGDSITVTDGTTITVITLTATDLSTGVVTTNFPSPVDGSSLVVAATLTDVSGNSSSSSSDSVNADFSQPSAPAIDIVEDTDNNTLISQAELIGTIDIRISLPADAVSGDVLTIEINGVPTSVTLSPVHITAGGINTHTLSPGDNATILAEAWVTDMSGNESGSTSDSAIIDLTAPSRPSVLSLLTSSATPTINGLATVSTGETLTVEINGIVYSAGDGNLTVNGDGTWELQIPAMQSLPEGILEVSVTVTDAAGNFTSDTSLTELEVDLTGPITPTVSEQTTNTATPVISGTATVNSGETLTVEVNNILYTAGDGNLVDNGDGTWNLLIPADNALPETTLDVLVSVSDAAGNTTTDATSGELLIDLTPPAIPTVTFLLTNNNEPTVAGNVASTLDDILTVTLNNVLYTDGDGHLTDNRDGTWALIIPTDDALPETTFDVIATLTDTAGNVTPDSSNPDLIIDLTPPPAPGVTSQTTMDSTPLISGTTTVGSGLTLNVEVNNVIYSVGDGHLIDNGDGTWDLTIPTALIDATYQVIATLTDAAGNVATDPGTDDLVVDTTAPTTPGVTSLTTNDTTPLISGTAASVAGDTLTVSVNTVTYTAGDGNLTDNGDGTWDLTIPNANLLPEAGYDVTATVTDAALNTSTDPSSSELLVDTTAPTAPTVTAQSINSITPLISGTATVNAGDTLTVEVNGLLYSAGDGSLQHNGDGTWDLTISTANTLTERNYHVIATVSDTAGNYISDATFNELTIDLSPPPAPVVTEQLVNIDTPVINGTATLIPGDVLTVDVNGVTYTAGEGDLNVNSDGSWILTIPGVNALPEGIVEVTAVVTDTAGNSTADISTTELEVDLTPPLQPTANPIQTNNQMPTLTGTALLMVGDTLTVNVAGTHYTVGDGHLLDNGDGTWSLTLPIPLNENSYSITATIIDSAGNETLGINSLIIDLTPPSAPGVLNQVTNQATPTINGTTVAGTAISLFVLVNGRTYAESDSALTNQGDGTWVLSIPITDQLADNLYQVVAVHTDPAGNTTSDAGIDDLLVDTLAPPAPGVMSQVTNNQTPHITGVTNGQRQPGDVLIVEVDGIEYTASILQSGLASGLVWNADNTWDLVIPNVLADGTYDVTARLTDNAGNSSTDPGAQELVIDTILPVAPGFELQTTNKNTPTLQGTATVAPGELLEITINGITYTDGDGNLINNGDGTWALAIPANHFLPDGSHTVVVRLTDAAGNVSVNASDQSIVIDTESPGLTVDATDAFQSLVPVFGGDSSEPDGSNVAVTNAAGDLLCTAVVRRGRWQCTSTSPLAYGENDLAASIVDVAGNTTRASFTSFISDDFDQDGISNEIEGAEDTDGDGIANHSDLDADNDGIPDSFELSLDSDGDGIANYLDLDSDNDGISDTLEVLGSDNDQNYVVDNFTDNDQNGLSDLLQTVPLQIPDTDSDGIADYLDLDSDQDGVPDITETDKVDVENDGRIDQFRDDDKDGIDDGVFAFPATVRDTDEDGIPDFRDSDSDGDGISDLVESGAEDINNDGVIDTIPDVDKDSIPDQVDVSYSGGFDSDGDGIDDRYDASFLSDGDQDGDGIADSYDPDANGDGYADSIDNGLTLSAALPDLDNNGVPDLQQAGSGGLRTGLSGRGGCTIGSANDSSLILLLLLSAWWLLRRRILFRSPSQLLVLFMCIAATPTTNAEEFNRRFYLSGGIGGSWLAPDDTESITKVTSKSDTALNIAFGLDINGRYSFELQYMDLGGASLTNDSSVTYQSPNASVLIYGGERQVRVQRTGFSYFGRLGLGQLRNESDEFFIRENDYHFLFGAGLEYGLKNGFAGRAEVISFDTDAHYGGVQLLYRFNQRRESKEYPTREIVSSITPDTRLPETLKEPTEPLYETILLTVFFDLEDSTLSQADSVALANLSTLLKNDSELHVMLIGYADATGPSDYNLLLSKERASEVSKWLENDGVPASQMSLTGFGETDQFGSTGTEQGRSANRRVNIVREATSERPGTVNSSSNDWDVIAE